MPKIPVKASIAYDTKKKKFAATKIRVLPAHDLRDAKSLIRNSKPKVIVADKAYDANWLHEYCNERGIKAHIPIKKKGKPRHSRWNARGLASKRFRVRTYHRRELGESGNSSAKRKFGVSVSSKKVRTIRTEIYGRLVCHNLFSYILRLLGQSQYVRLSRKS